MKNKIFYLSSTHWDREWYLPFQGFRFHLVRVMDALVDCLETSDRESVFHLDGQTIMLEDYYEMRPLMRPRVEKLIREGRILVGPWYNMPDEFNVSGEALIRNLLLGHRLSLEAGTEAWKCGYVIDIFGHIAQFPQILNGFGIKTAVVGRGTNEHTTPLAFTWESPDGSGVTSFKLPDYNGYGSFSTDVAGRRVTGDYYPPDNPLFDERAKKYINHELARSPLPFCVLWDSMDHEPYHEDTQAYVARLRELYPDSDILQTDLLKAFDYVEKSGVSLQVKKGELREPGRDFGHYAYVLIHCLSARHSLKKHNDRTQALLEKAMEPLAVYFSRMGIRQDKAFTDLAWKYLLKNHPHDSICGCSVDRVHEDMTYRFNQAQDICDTLITDARRTLTEGTRLVTSEENLLCVLNSLPYAREEVVTLSIPFSKDYPKWQEPFGYEALCAFEIRDETGTALPYTLLTKEESRNVRGRANIGMGADSYTVAVKVSLPALGAANLSIVPVNGPVRQTGGMADSSGSLDNGLVRITINPDGTINLMDYLSGREYARLLQLTDCGEIGDAWNHVRPANGGLVTGGVLVHKEIVVNSTVKSTVRLVRELTVPARIQASRNGLMPSQEKATLECEFLISLAEGSRNPEISLNVNNTACDHVLRLGFPTHTAGDTYEANQAFCFVTRKTGFNTETLTWKESEKPEAPMSGIVLKRDASYRGLAFVSDYGLHECAADTDKDATLRVTLLRSFGKTVTTNGEPGGQELGLHSYRFFLVPLDETIKNSDLQRLQDGLQASPVHFVSPKAAAGSTLEVEGPLCASTVKHAQDGSEDIVVRLYNPNNANAQGKLHVSGIREAFFTNMLEEVTEPAEITLSQEKDSSQARSQEKGFVSLSLEPFRIVTLRLKPYAMPDESASSKVKVYV